MPVNKGGGGGQNTPILHFNNKFLIYLHRRISPEYEIVSRVKSANLHLVPVSLNCFSHARSTEIEFIINSDAILNFELMAMQCDLFSVIRFFKL